MKKNIEHYLDGRLVLKSELPKDSVHVENIKRNGFRHGNTPVIVIEKHYKSKP